MKVIFDVNHPAHVHVFKNAAWALMVMGHKVAFVASEKDVTIDLLDLLNLPYVNIGSYGTGGIKKAANLPLLDYKFLKLARSFKPDILLGISSIRSAHIGSLLKIPSLVFTDTEHCWEQHILFAPFATKIITPNCFKKSFGKKQIRYEGYHELAYLRPEYFRPDPTILKELGLRPGDPFFLVRLAAFDATHDGRSEKFKREYVPALIEKLDKYGRIIISSERQLEGPLEKYRYSLTPEKYHHVLYYSQLYIGEGSTSAEEAAILGVPSLHFERVNIRGEHHSIVEFNGVLDELQNKYSILLSFFEEDALLKVVDEMLTNITYYKSEWVKKSKALINNTIDVSKFVLGLIQDNTSLRKNII